MKPLIYCVILALFQSWAGAQELEFHPPAGAADPAVPAIMRDLAQRILPVYQEKDPERYLRNLSALQLVDGNFDAANESRQSLRDRRRSADSHRPIGRAVLYDIYFRARQREADERLPFSQAYTQSFWDVVTKLSDEDSFVLAGWLAQSPAEFQDGLQRAFDQWRPKGSIPLADAVELLWTYVSFDAYRNFHPFVAALEAEDDSRRYITDWDALIDTPDGSSISAVIVRPRDDSKSLPALLEFTIYVDPTNLAKENAAHGYVGIVAFSRGERRSRGPIVPFERDGDDVRTVINWITRQTWSDGRVGMYGSTYSGFTQWAAATKLPTALKAIATSSATAPGVDVPMAGSIVHNSGFRWSACISNIKGLDEKTCADDAAWRALDEKWYTSGRPYLDLEQIAGKHDPIFRTWLDHPSYDRFWQKFIPYRKQFSHINIPVLTTTGYFAAGEPGALYYFTQHYKYNPHANQTLLIGPYDDGSMQRGVAASLQGYQLDAAAMVDLRELRYQWFDSIFKGSEPPPLLKDRVNYEVMGANEWRHAPSIEAMANHAVRFYLDASPVNGGHLLAQRKTSDATFVAQKVNLADRSDSGLAPATSIVGKALDPQNAVLFVSEPLGHPLELAGLFSGKLDFTVNKMDMDLNVALYEQLANGDFIELFEPSYDFRASYATDRGGRRLLKAGERQQLVFKSERLTSRTLAAGSRVVVVLGINKRADRQINYGTGKAVNEEAIIGAIRSAAIPVSAPQRNPEVKTESEVASGAGAASSEQVPTDSKASSEAGLESGEPTPGSQSAVSQVPQKSRASASGEANPSQASPSEAKPGEAKPGQANEPGEAASGGDAAPGDQVVPGGEPVRSNEQPSTSGSVPGGEAAPNTAAVAENEANSSGSVSAAPAESAMVKAADAEVEPPNDNDAKIPMRIRWYSDSFIDLPTRR